MTIDIIEKINNSLNKRKLLETKKLIGELEQLLKRLDNLQEFYEEIIKLIMNLGNSNMIHKDEINNLLKEYKEKK